MVRFGMHDEESLLELYQSKSVFNQYREIQLSLFKQAQIMFHCVKEYPIVFLHNKGVRTDELNFLKIMRCPLEAIRHADTGDHNRRM
jgi:hypothetical protein